MPVDLNQFLALIQQNRDFVYGLMFAWAASHSLLMTLFAGYAAHIGVIDWTALVLVCWAGSCAGDLVRFWIGRRFGIRLLTRYPAFERAVQSVIRMANRHYILMPMIHRYPNLIRGIAGFAYGMSNLPASTFLALNVIASGVWAVAIVGAGYGFGHLSEKVLSDAASGVGLAAMLVFLALFWLLSKRLDRVIERN
jgi:membrane protein DedA with SNARE-associated domain